MKHDYKTVLRLIPCLCFLIIVFGLSWTNRNVAKKLSDHITPAGIMDFTNSMEKHLADNFVQKTDFLELNGTLTRLLGIHSLNERQLLESGSLAAFPYFNDNTTLLNRIADLSAFLADEEIGFLCVPIPFKEESYAAQEALGYEDGHSIIVDFMANLDARGIPNVNMDAWYQENGWTVEDIYYRTDHHWNAKGTFAAVTQIMKKFSELYGTKLNADTLNLDNWNVEIYKDWFLGSEGRRVGATYAGVDDMIYIYPKFDTDIYMARVTEGGTLDLSNEHTVYFTSYLNAPDWYHQPAECLYGANYPLAVIRNPLAVNDQKLVVIGDSFRIPAQCFLTTQFSEVYHIDMRYYTGGTFLEFIQQIDPDLVLLLFCSPQDGDKHNFGIDEWNHAFAGKAPSDPMLVQDALVLEETAAAEDYRIIAPNLHAGAYQLTLEEALLSRNPEIQDRSPGMFVQFSLVDLKTGVHQATRYFFANYDEPQTWFFTIPENPNASYAVVAYNGNRFHTAGNTTTIHQLALTPYF